MFFQKIRTENPITNKNIYTPQEAEQYSFCGKVCSFTGHRPQKLNIGNEKDPECVHLKKMLRDEILHTIDQGYTGFISGMAPGTDLWAAEITLNIKLIYDIWDKDLKLYAAVPFDTQDKYWNDEIKERYYHVLNSCDGIFYICDESSKSAYLRRNDFLVKNASKLIAVYNGSQGGTAYTVEHARKKGLDVSVILPVK